MSKLAKTVVVVGLSCALSASVLATPIEFTGSSGGLAASALFEVDGSTLVVTLTNTSTEDVAVPAEILTALFFSSDVPLTLTRTSAVVPAGSSVAFGGTDPGGVVGGEWAYRSGLVGAPGGRPYGISSAGFGLFGPGDVFPGTNLQGPAAPDGLQYGITSAGDDTGTGNAAVTGGNALIKNQVVFRLDGLPDGFNPEEAITSVFFQYGTNLDEGGFEIPEPHVVALMALGGLFINRRYRRAG
ncbi:MAG: PEP-CTERM sorting domain-containing protein [Planctomycetes bacterium]|nr:PEP-CTERM sorting domain-containing protein [Planctomycetota bacterium]